MARIHRRTIQKKDLHDPYGHDAEITHPESDTLECNVKWALESITMNKASGGDGWNSGWAFSNPKRWYCESAALNMSTDLENSAVATGLKKVSFYSNPKERRCQRTVKLCTTALISHASKVMFKIPQERLQQYMNHELPGVQVGFPKGRGPRDQIANIHGSLKKHEHSWKTSTSDSLIMPKPLTVWMTTSNGKFLKSWEYQTTYLPPEKSVCKSRSNS